MDGLYVPYAIDAWTGAVTELADYRWGRRPGPVVSISIASVPRDENGEANAPGVHHGRHGRAERLPSDVCLDGVCVTD